MYDEKELSDFLRDSKHQDINLVKINIVDKYKKTIIFLYDGGLLSPDISVFLSGKYEDIKEMNKNTLLIYIRRIIKAHKDEKLDRRKSPESKKSVAKSKLKKDKNTVVDEDKSLSTDVSLSEADEKKPNSLEWLNRSETKLPPSDKSLSEYEVGDDFLGVSQQLQCMKK